MMGKVEALKSFVLDELPEIIIGGFIGLVVVIVTLLAILVDLAMWLLRVMIVPTACVACVVIVCWTVLKAAGVV